LLIDSPDITCPGPMVTGPLGANVAARGPALVCEVGNELAAEALVVAGAGEFAADAVLVEAVCVL
jgi:hypothetical protein